ncbi:hypothetical protein BHM03_00027117 [Ensete ventricosum]|nr:hypothetical protein BHM03_00027117 [Ensete ventricosum]
MQELSTTACIRDSVAEAVGLPLLPPSTAKGKNFLRGANFAYTAATALDFGFFDRRGLGSKLWVNSSLSSQVRSFEQMMPSLCSSTQGASTSLFIVGEFGGNDYNTAIFAGRSMAEVNSYVPKVMRAIKLGVEKGIKNAQLVVDLCHHQLHLSFALRIQLHLLPFTGFTGGALKACCGAGGSGKYNVNLDKVCAKPGSSVCKDPSTYVSWDGSHLTETAYNLIADGWLRGPYAKPSIMQWS